MLCPILRRLSAMLVLRQVAEYLELDGQMQQPAFFMLFIDNDNYFGNYKLLEKPIVSFMAANDTPEELWSRVERWLEQEIYGTNRAILSHFETPFEKRVLQLLLKHNRPIILFTYHSTSKASLRELKVSPTNANRLVLRYRPSQDALPSKDTDLSRMVIANISDEFITIGATSDDNILTILDLYRQSSQKHHRML